jgi:hypothetical protein
MTRDRVDTAHQQVDARRDGGSQLRGIRRGLKSVRLGIAVVVDAELQLQVFYALDQALGRRHAIGGTPLSLAAQGGHAVTAGNRIIAQE